MVDIELKVRGPLFFLSYKWADVCGPTQLNIFIIHLRFRLYILCICRTFIALLMKTTNNWNNPTLFLALFFCLFLFKADCDFSALVSPHPLHALPSHRATSGSASLPYRMLLVLQQNEGDIRLMETHIFPRGAEGDENRAK